MCAGEVAPWKSGGAWRSYSKTGNTESNMFRNADLEPKGGSLVSLCLTGLDYSKDLARMFVFKTIRTMTQH